MNAVHQSLQLCELPVVCELLDESSAGTTCHVVPSGEVQVVQLPLSDGVLGQALTVGSPGDDPSLGTGSSESPDTVPEPLPPLHPSCKSTDLISDDT